MAQIINMPKLSDTMTLGTLVKWLKPEGAAVKSGDILAEVETDKATMELESFFDGTLLRQFVAVGAQIPIGGALCAIGAPGEKVDAPAAPPQAPQPAPPPASIPSVPAAPPPVAVPASRPQPPVAVPGSPPVIASPVIRAAAVESVPPAAGQVRISPLARKLATAAGVDYSRLQGTGPGGRIMQADILAAVKQAPVPSGPVSALSGVPSLLAKGPVQDDGIVPLSNMRATIARRMVESKTQIPHFYLEVEVDAGPLLDLRAQLNAGLKKDGVVLSVNDFILKGAASALRVVPEVNCSWEIDPAGQPAIRRHSAVHLSFAVALDEGLVTPVIRDAHEKTVFQISTEVRDLAALAKARKLKPEQYSGGTFCLSNLGMMGIERFTAVINPPNAAILAIGAIVKKPVVRDNQIVIGQRMSLFISCDHRVVDGATGARYLAGLKELLEKPALLLL